MHGLGTLAHLNTEAIERARDKTANAGYEARAEAEPEAKAEAGYEAEAETTYNLSELEDVRQEALEEGREQGREEGHESAYEYGHEDGLERGKEEAEEEFSGISPILELLRLGDIDPLTQVTVQYDAALKALVWTQSHARIVQP